MQPLEHGALLAFGSEWLTTWTAWMPWLVTAALQLSHNERVL